MNIRAYKIIKASFWLLFLVGPVDRVCAQSTFALPFSLNQTSPASSFGFDGNGNFSLTGTYTGSTTFTFSGTPQVAWIPNLMALRVGNFNYTSSSVGPYSFAFGNGGVASGGGSVCLGGGGYASGSNAVVLGAASGATGDFSLVGGFCSYATGPNSTAFGTYTSASGFTSTTTGYATGASGAYSTAAGYGTTANSVGSFVTGQWNLGLSASGATPNATTWVATDPLLEVGNGTNSSTKSDAFVVYKNGNATFQGVVKVAAGGDIPMYTGN